MTYITNLNFLIEVAKGEIPGHSIIHKFGRNPDVDTAAPETIWTGGGLWVEPSGSQIFQIASDDVNDAAAGTGARTIRIEGLDASFLDQTEDVILNGTTDVATANSYTMIHRMYTLTAGSGLANEGNITATGDSDAVVTSHILINANQTLHCVYQIPSGKTGFILRWFYGLNKSGGSAASADVAAYFKPDGGVFRVTRWVGVTSDGTGQFQETTVIPTPAPSKSILRIDAAVTANNTDIFAGFDILLVDD